MLGGDPFEKGWSFGLNIQQRMDIKEMFYAGLREGMIPQRPDQKKLGYLVEHPFTLTMDGGKLPFFVGFIDLIFPIHNLVIDWKTTSSWNYAKTSEDLKVNTQVLVYAKVLQHLRRELGLPESEGFKVAHGSFLKKTPRNYKQIEAGEPRTRYVDTEVSWVEALQRWDECVTMARDMVALAQQAEDWYDIPEPTNKKESCEAFGGCEYKDVCFARLTKEQWHEGQK